MNRDELFELLELQFTGKKGKKHITIREYWNLPPEEGLRKAEKYLEDSNIGQDNCQSDWAYWVYEGDITLATILTEVFKALKTGIKDFPNPPDVRGDFLMDKADTLQKWAEGLKGVS